MSWVCTGLASSQGKVSKLLRCRPIGGKIFRSRAVPVRRGREQPEIGHQPLGRALVEPGALHGHAGQQAHGGLRAGHVAAGAQREAEEAVEPLDPVGGVQGPLRRGGEAEVGEVVAVGLVPLQPAEVGVVPRPAGQEVPPFAPALGRGVAGVAGPQEPV